MNQRKLFLGVPVSGPTRKAIVRQIETWGSLPLIPTDPGNLHVTMFFLGFVEDIDLPEICRTIEEVVAGVSPFDLEFSEIALEPEDREPDMIWLSGEPSEGALLLRNALEAAFTNKIVKNKHFRPHMTLARLRRSKWKTLESAPSFPISLHAFEPVSSLTLFEVHTENGRRKYVSIDEFPLGG